MFHKQVVDEINVAGKRVLVRVDYNVPFAPDGTISDDYRVRASLPTIEYLVSRGCRVVLCAHLGRPDGKRTEKDSLKPVFELLSGLLQDRSYFVDAVVGEEVARASGELAGGEVLLLQNLRFEAGEEENSLEFAQRLVDDTGAEIFVQDGFGVCHRKSATTEVITHILPAVAGFLVKKEVSELTEVVDEPKRPFIAILGGAKVNDKIPILKKIIDKADKIFLGGAMANAFLRFNKYEIGLSHADDDADTDIEEIYALAQAKTDEVNEFLVLPSDVVIASEISAKTETAVTEIDNVYDQDMILDIGPESRKAIGSALENAKTVFWNGTMGVSEYSKFAHGSNYVARTMGRMDADTVVCGGDTAGFVINFAKDKDDLHYSLISTGGGASLELLGGEKLVGVESLMNKEVK
ncbi:MAG: phosphoglycerate kinase [Candidatus Nomurabacteria bacterium]|jgi:phosphoglycerate kinase|nr:phosphoglycerate kinase [Candidatus Nomurabacteria bacterium]